jgi:hypothetical protein
MRTTPVVPGHLANVVRTLALGMLLSCALETSGQEKPFDPTRQQKLSIEASGVTVKLRERVPCQTCPSRSRFILQSVQKGTKRRLVLENETAQIDDLRLAEGHKLVIFGRVLANTSIVTIIDILSGKEVDSFFCFKPNLSPDGRFIVFEKVYPAHFTPGTSAQYLIYEIEVGSERNRRSGIPIDNRIDVGQPVFPSDAQNKPGDNINVPHDEQHTRVSTEFFWSKDSSLVMFLDRAQGTNSLVLVDVSGWPQAPGIRTVPLETARIVDPERCPNYEGRLEAAFHVVDIAAQADRQVTLRFRSHVAGCLRQPVMTLRFN